MTKEIVQKKHRTKNPCIDISLQIWVYFTFANFCFQRFILRDMFLSSTFVQLIKLDLNRWIFGKPSNDIIITMQIWATHKYYAMDKRIKPTHNNQFNSISSHPLLISNRYHCRHCHSNSKSSQPAIPDCVVIFVKLFSLFLCTETNCDSYFHIVFKMDDSSEIR